MNAWDLHLRRNLNDIEIIEWASLSRQLDSSLMFNVKSLMTDLVVAVDRSYLTFTLLLGRTLIRRSKLFFGNFVWVPH